MGSTLKLLESSDQQATTIIADNDGLKIRTPKTNSANKGTRSCGCCYNKKGTRNCASCFNKGGIYEQIDSVVAHEINVTYYRVVKCIVNAEGIVHLSVVSSQHDDHLVEFKGSPTNIPIEDAKTMIDDIRNKAAIGDPKRFLVLVNPVGGQGKAIRYYNEKVFPILRASGFKIDFQSKPVIVYKPPTHTLKCLNIKCTLTTLVRKCNLITMACCVSVVMVQYTKF